MEFKIALYPGTFDPITNGHIDLIKRALKFFDKIIVAIGENPAKKPLFSLEERMEMITKSLEELNLLDRVEVDFFSGLLVEFAKKKGATAIIRGLRAVSDFEYEMQMALMNRKLSNSIDTLFLMPSLKYIFLSSSIIKEAAKYGGSVEDLVPKIVSQKLKEKFYK